jgi:hypothetical protein
LPVGQISGAGACGYGFKPHLFWIVWCCMLKGTK